MHVARLSKSFPYVSRYGAAQCQDCTILEKSHRTAGEKIDLWQIKIDELHIMIRISTWYVPARQQLQAAFTWTRICTDL